MVVGVKVVAEHFSVRIGYRIDDYMIVQVAFVQMGADRTLKPIRKKPPCKFTANFMYFVRACFTGAETLDNMIGQNSFVHRFAPCALCLLHNRAGIFRITTKACNIQLTLGLSVIRFTPEGNHKGDNSVSEKSQVGETIYPRLSGKTQLCE